MKISHTSIPYLLIVAFVVMFAAIAQAGYDQDWEEDDTVIVGRVSHLKGTLMRYDAEQDDWEFIDQYAPVGAGDRLYSEPEAKVELMLPNNTWIRLDGDTEIEITALDEDFTGVNLSLGTARLYNRSKRARIEATTPFGTIRSPAGSQADLYVYSDGVDIIALDESVFFIHKRSKRRHEVASNGPALFANNRRVSASQADVATEWDNWNNKMDITWAKHTRSRGKSATYLPPELHYDAYYLDTYGRWDRVYYMGAYYRFWRPSRVHVSWTPFSAGYWRVWWGDHVWIPHAPYGYVTHHYGNWIFTAGHWYWAPPVTRVMVRAGLPLLRIGYAWYPGRVAWIHASAHVGWFPLGPYEPYYTHRHWGRRAYVVNKHRHRHYHRHHYKHRRHAVVINKKHLYRGKSYQKARVKNSARLVETRKFRTEPVLNKAVVKEYRHQSDAWRSNQRINRHEHHKGRTRPDRPDLWRTQNARPNPSVTRDTSRNRGKTIDRQNTVRRGRPSVPEREVQKRQPEPRRSAETRHRRSNLDKERTRPNATQQGRSYRTPGRNEAHRPQPHNPRNVELPPRNRGYELHDGNQRQMAPQQRHDSRRSGGRRGYRSDR